MKTIYISVLFLFFINVSFAQKIKGIVKDDTQNPLIGANIVWIGTTNGTTSDLNGQFEIQMPKTNDHRLVISYVGFASDTISVHGKTNLEIILKSTQLAELVVEASKNNPQELRQTEIITLKDLRKAACCNLSESFETNASVDVSVSDAVSGTKQIKMLGLDGVYTQITTENIPSVRGLAARSGLYFIPGTWISSIDVSKGVGSVVNGYESTTGQINVELQKPESSERFFMNLYANHIGRMEGNFHFAKKLNEKWSTLLLTHGSNLSFEQDHNHDGFLEQPLFTQINVLNRWKYQSEKMMSQFGVKYIFDDKKSGQTTEHAAHTKLYEANQLNKKAEIFGKTAFFLGDNKSIGLMASYSLHDLSSLWGLNRYKAQQNYAYFNAIFQHEIDKKHTYKLGTSLINDRYEENLNDSLFGRNEKVIGLFGEYGYNVEDKFSLVAGFRADYHNLFGFIPTPRLHLKYFLSPKTVLRLSAGRGFRVANLVAENWAYMISSRNISFQKDLKPEIAWNYGISLTQDFFIGKNMASLSVDFYRTDFENQIIVDLFTPQKLAFYNLNGKSYANSFQIGLDFEPLENFDVSLAYKYYDVKSTYGENLEQKPFVAQNRFFTNLAYETPNEKWRFDWTAQWYGKQRLVYSNESFSPTYWLFNAQMTRVFGDLEVYLGAENLFNYTQQNPIIGSANPFGKDFDAGNIYAPIMGRMIYGGLRFSLK